jgi:hypothetical protein
MEESQRLPDEGAFAKNPFAIVECLNSFEGKSPIQDKAKRNPPWSRDELTLALNLYLRFRDTPPRRTVKKCTRFPRSAARWDARLAPLRATRLGYIVGVDVVGMDVIHAPKGPRISPQGPFPMRLSFLIVVAKSAVQG